MKDMAALEPLDAARLERLNDNETRIVDQFIYRYTCLQDALGQKAFKTLLEASQEPLAQGATFLDRLHALERLQVLSAEDWELTRIIRNRLVHEYPDAEKRLQILRTAMSTARTLTSALTQIHRIAKEKLGIPRAGH
ncbi:MAG: hypothetical protein AB7P11_21255 [Hydrogenophaga sp.]|uniref:hypothetical protein n=1 Tax=Hydrogenophaga sp. TaxID=1904254 RepID=UPI003D09C5D2